MENQVVSVNSEVGLLKKVLLHRPGQELEHLTPHYLEEMLFDDIPFLSKMVQEHDQFASTLRSQGVKVYYYDELLKEVLKGAGLREQFIQQVLQAEGISYPRLRDEIKTELFKMQAEDLASVMIHGLPKSQVHLNNSEKRLSYYIKENYPFYINPLPNLYFTRDPGVVIGNGVAISSMHTVARRRESMILKIIMENHKEFVIKPQNFLYDHRDMNSIEGGDILVLSSKVLAVGCSNRTSPEAIEKLADRLLFSDSLIEKILVIQIPFARAYMHLDTVFTMVDWDKFTLYPGVESRLKVFRLEKGQKGLKITEEDRLQEALTRCLKLPSVQFLYSGGGDPVTAAREQWNDSTNTLAIGPGKVVTYNRNVVSNETLRKGGIDVVEIEGSELVRGRGGPRCMSMPLFRESLE